MSRAKKLVPISLILIMLALSAALAKDASAPVPNRTTVGEFALKVVRMAEDNPAVRDALTADQAIARLKAAGLRLKGSADDPLTEGDRSAFALAVVGIPIYVYLPKFYTDVVGIDITALGTILASVRIFDAITDPPMGHISDRTVSRFGRRRPYIAVGAVFVALFIFLLFNPPEGSPSFETVWFGTCIYALFLFWTVVTVPYESLGPEITFDYNERNALFALRDGLLIAGTLAGFFPAVRNAKLEKAHVIKEVRATFSAGPGMAKHRPSSVTAIRNLFLAGDWTDSGWPSTMEGAVRSGYLAAEAVTAAAGAPRRFLLPDIG